MLRVMKITAVALVAGVALYAVIADTATTHAHLYGPMLRDKNTGECFYRAGGNQLVPTECEQ